MYELGSHPPAGAIPVLDEADNDCASCLRIVETLVRSALEQLNRTSMLGNACIHFLHLSYTVLHARDSFNQNTCTIENISEVAMNVL